MVAANAAQSGQRRDQRGCIHFPGMRQTTACLYGQSCQRVFSPLTIRLYEFNHATWHFLHAGPQTEKPWQQALEEDRQAVILADRCGYAEAWMGEHFSTKVEQVPAPLMFFSTLIHETTQIRFGTGVVNLGHRHPIVVAAEAAQFDQLSNGRLMLGVGPGGLMSDGELFGRPDMAERVKAAIESIDMIVSLWQDDAPLSLQGQYWQAQLHHQIWPSHGVGALCKPLQAPHPPLMMAMVSPGGRTAETIAERSYIPMSANFVPLDVVAAQWQSYAARRDALDLPAERNIWRVCRNILVTDSDAEAEDLLAESRRGLRVLFPVPARLARDARNRASPRRYPC